MSSFRCNDPHDHMVSVQYTEIDNVLNPPTRPSLAMARTRRRARIDDVNKAFSLACRYVLFRPRGAAASLARPICAPAQLLLAAPSGTALAVSAACRWLFASSGNVVRPMAHHCRTMDTTLARLRWQRRHEHRHATRTKDARERPSWSLVTTRVIEVQARLRASGCAWRRWPILGCGSPAPT
jgi:hypothetical protein